MADKNEYRSPLAEAERLLSERINAAAQDRIKLRNAVCTFLSAERARGTSIESVRMTVEEILRRAEAGAEDGDDGHRELAQQLIDWCVKRDSR